jgi:hypothetical protein
MYTEQQIYTKNLYLFQKFLQNRFQFRKVIKDKVAFLFECFISTKSDEK